MAVHVQMQMKTDAHEHQHVHDRSERSLLEACEVHAWRVSENRSGKVSVMSAYDPLGVYDDDHEGDGDTDRLRMLCVDDGYRVQNHHIEFDHAHDCVCKLARAPNLDDAHTHDHAHSPSLSFEHDDSADDPTYDYDCHCGFCFLCSNNVMAEWGSVGVSTRLDSIVPPHIDHPDPVVDQDHDHGHGHDHGHDHRDDHTRAHTHSREYGHDVNGGIVIWIVHVSAMVMVSDRSASGLTRAIPMSAIESKKACGRWRRRASPPRSCVWMLTQRR